MKKALILVAALLLAPFAKADGTATPSKTVTPSHTQSSTPTPVLTATPTSTATQSFTITPTFTSTITKTTTPTPTETLVVVKPLNYDTSVKKVVGINAQGTPVPVATTFKTVILQSVSGATSVWTPASGKKFRLTGFMVHASVAGNYTLFDGANTVTAFAVPAVNTPFVSPPWGMGVLSSAANTPLKLLGPVAATTPNTATGTFFGTEE